MKLSPVDQGNGITFWTTDNGSAYSMDPFDAWDDMNPWAKMMPPMRPRNALILGVAKNTLGRRMRKEWPDLPITLVDLDPIEGDLETIRSDAWEFVKKSPDDAFDFIAVDIWHEEVMEPYVCTYEFCADVARVGKRAVLNIPTVQLEGLRPWLNSGLWRLQNYRNQNSNHIWHFARARR